MSKKDKLKYMGKLSKNWDVDAEIRQERIQGQIELARRATEKLLDDEEADEERVLPCGKVRREHTRKDWESWYSDLKLNEILEHYVIKLDPYPKIVESLVLDLLCDPQLGICLVVTLISEYFLESCMPPVFI